MAIDLADVIFWTVYADVLWTPERYSKGEDAQFQP